jgi:hypothetical protein
MDIRRAMKISDNAAELLAALFALQGACSGGVAGSIEQLAARCEEAALRLTADDFAACDGEALANLRRAAKTTAAFLRRMVRLRGMRLTIRRFGQVESADRRGIAM